MTAVAAKKVEVTPPAKALRLPHGSLKLVEHCRRMWFVQAPEGTTKEDPLYPGFWVNESKKFTRHDIIFLIAPDEAWEMELTVEAVRVDGIEVGVRKVYSRKGIMPTMTEVAPGFHTEYRAGSGWCVIRRKDNHPIVKGAALESIAIAEWQRQQPRPVV
jgi:hypothetical protein